MNTQKIFWVEFGNIIVVGIIIIVLAFGGLVYQSKQNYDQTISDLQKNIHNLSGKYEALATLNQEQQQAQLLYAQNQQNLVSQLSDQQQKLATQEQANRQIAHSKSQDELLTAAVAKVTPAVVSIVISKDVPQMQVVYVNPFGNDPQFKDFGFQVPVYQQNGVQHQKIGAGTGFLISSDGYILTNKHVVYDDQADYTVLLANGKQLQAKVIYKDAANDLAIVKIDGGPFASLTLGDSSNLELGQTVIAIGNALGQYNNSVSVGIISGLNRSITASSPDGSTEQLSGVIQTDAAINPGNSGGPLLDLNGLVMGVNVATVQGSNNISFSIPINVAKDIVKTVIGR